MANSIDLKYYALPDRLYLIGPDGRVAYRGGPGPFGFVASDLEVGGVCQLVEKQ